LDLKFLSYFLRSRKEVMREKINRAIKGIEVHRREIDNLKLRLENRRKALYEIMIRAKQSHEDAKAIVYANELVELKRVIRVVTTSQLALTQIVTRMESMRDVGDAIFQMSTAMEEVGKVNKSVSDIIPSFNGATEQINSTLSETMTDLGQVSPGISINLESDSSSEIIESAMRYADEKVSELKEDRAVLLKTRDGHIIDQVKKVALLTTGDDEDSESEFKPVVLSVPRKEAIENKVENYYKMNGGRFTVMEAAAELRLPLRDVETAAVSLVSKGKIKSRRDDLV
jgi:division protein CdvB (Snf7/Vps24/ESCRT-III family)